MLLFILPGLTLALKKPDKPATPPPPKNPQTMETKTPPPKYHVLEAAKAIRVLVLGVGWSALPVTGRRCCSWFGA